jgi:hypothetical protein
MIENTCVILGQFREEAGGMVPTPAPSTFYDACFFGQAGGASATTIARQRTRASTSLEVFLAGWTSVTPEPNMMQVHTILYSADEHTIGDLPRPGQMG